MVTRSDAGAKPGPSERLANALASARRLAPFAGMYAAYGATFGLLGGGAPLVFRAHGMSLRDVGLLQLMYVPIGIAFLWAPVIDRTRLAYLAHRKAWIVTAQGTTVLLLLVLSLATAWPVVAIFTLALAVSGAMATADVALEALVVETIEPAGRPLVTTAKLVGSSLGTMAGVGVVTAFPANLDLRTSILLIAALDTVLLVPMLRFPEPWRDIALPAGRMRHPAGERIRFLARRAGVLGLFFTPAILLVSVPSLVLLDLQLSLPTVGLFTGTLTTVINLGMTVISGVLLTRMTAHRLVAMLAAGVALGGTLFAVATGLHSAALGVAAALLIVIFEGGLGVPVFNVIYQWAEGERAGTDYALLFGVAFVVSFPARVAGPMLAAWIGWPTYFALVVPFYVVAVAVLVVMMRGTREREPAVAKPGDAC